MASGEVERPHEAESVVSDRDGPSGTEPLGAGETISLANAAKYLDRDAKTIGRMLDREVLHERTVNGSRAVDKEELRTRVRAELVRRQLGELLGDDVLGGTPGGVGGARESDAPNVVGDPQGRVGSAEPSSGAEQGAERGAEQGATPDVGPVSTTGPTGGAPSPNSGSDHDSTDVARLEREVLQLRSAVRALQTANRALTDHMTVHLAD